MLLGAVFYGEAVGAVGALGAAMILLGAIAVVLRPPRP
jgi:drug/metabolite transporter (DMT)-like permease